MASSDLQGKFKDISTNFLPFMDYLVKIPEPQSVSEHNYYLLPCSNDYSLVTIYVDLFTILGVLFGIENLRDKVLLHIRRYWKYYHQISQTYLYRKRLNFIEWLTQMNTFQQIPADEICLHACGTYLNIHISVLYIGGIWTTLNLPTASYDLLLELCDVQLAYMGNNNYNLLCKHNDLKTKARKLFNYKHGSSHTDTANTVWIKLSRIEYSTMLPDNLYISQYSMNKLKQLRTKASADKTPSLPSTCSQYGDKNEAYNTSTEYYSDSEDTELYFLSDSTDYYEIDEILIGSLQEIDTKATHIKNRKAICVKPNKNDSVKLFKFKCPLTQCSVRSKSRKTIHKHYMSSHHQQNVCKLCDKKYNTPHSLKQHLYGHLKTTMNHKCLRCMRKFPFYSQLKIHMLSHTKKAKYTCNECYQTYKFRHDMQRHRRQHFAPTVKCANCDYEGTPLSLREHIIQHDTKRRINCKICYKSFTYRMSHWRHLKTCKIRRSTSPAY